MTWLYLAIASTAVEEESLITGFNHLAEDLLLEVAVLLKIVVEAIALLILALAIVRAVRKLVFRNRKMDREQKLAQVRLDLGIALALSLEFLLAADIAATAVSPTWTAVGKLAAISGIRTFLNFFLEREVKELEKEKLQRFKTKEFKKPQPNI